MKKLAWVLIFVLLMTIVFVPVHAAEPVVTANQTGYNDVPFSNGYNGFCLDKWLDIAYAADGFTVAETETATNNGSGESIAQYLKILFVDFFDTVFEKAAEGEYKINNPTMTQATIYGFTDNASKDWDYEPLTSVVAKYNSGRRVKDHGESIVVGEDKITFDFIVLKSQKDGQQDFFGYKLTVEKNVHEHEFSKDWKSDDEYHWHECECQEKADLTKHDGNKPNCVTPSKCIECEKNLADVDPNTHTGNTVVKDAADPEIGKPGYTGDTYCKDCDVIIKNGTAVPALPSVDPTIEPTATPVPTVAPTIEPTTAPTAEPTVEPTTEPIGTPTVEPSQDPAISPIPESTQTPGFPPAIDNLPNKDDLGIKDDTEIKDDLEINDDAGSEEDVNVNGNNQVDEDAGGQDATGGIDTPPKTGDSGYLGWMALVLLSLAGMVIIARKHKALAK